VQEMLVARKTRTREALALMWCAGQLPEKDLAQGLTVWMEVMLPQLSVKQLTKYSISYLENLLSTCNPVSSQGRLVESKEFFAVMEVAFSPSSPLAGNPSLQRKMLSLYPKIKRLSLGSESRPVSRLYFPALLGRLNSELPLEYQTEVLSCLVMCLQKDEDCFTKWESSYLATLQQSGLLLNHFVNMWNSLSTGLKSKLFHTVDVFQSKNNPLLENNKTKAGLDSCVKACQAVKEKKACRSSSFFSLGKLLKLVLLLLVAAVAIDIYKHKGYKDSKTAQIAKEYGIEKAAVTGYGQVKDGFDVANSWVQTNYPTYYSKFREHADPAAAFVWEKLTIVGAFIAETTKPARDYFNVKIPQLLEKVRTKGPVYLGIVRDYLKHAWNTCWPVVHKYLVIVWDFLSEHVPVLLAKAQELLTNLAYKIYELAPDFFSSVASWFAKLGEKIVEKLPDVLAVIQEYAIIAVNLAVNLIHSAVEWVQNMAGSAEVQDTVHQKSTMAGSSKPVPQ
ncbi:transmembrane protein 214-B-like, partial [Oculina patagonica]